MTITDIVQRSDTPAGRTFDSVVIALIIISLISMSIDTLPGTSPNLKYLFHVSEVTVTVLFTIEYVLRVATAPKKMSYIFSFYGIIDLAAIVPFYLTLGGVDLRGIRAFRLFRIIRVVKLTRYNTAMMRFGKALVDIKEEAVVFFSATAILLYVSAVGIYYFEHEAQPENFQSIIHSLWWAVITLTTVGYGDVYPITAGGKFFTFVILMCGLGIVAVPAGLIASSMSKVRQAESQNSGTKGDPS